MIVIQDIVIRLGEKPHRCRALFDYQYFHMAIMSKKKFREFFGETWETGAKVEVVLSTEHIAYLSEYAVVNIEVSGKTLKNVYIWLIDQDLRDILPQQYLGHIVDEIDIILGSTILENYGIKILKDKATGELKIQL